MSRRDLIAMALIIMSLLTWAAGTPAIILSGHLGWAWNLAVVAGMWILAYLGVADTLRWYCREEVPEDHDRA